MAIPQWHDLTQEEQQAIAELYTGFTSLLTARMYCIKITPAMPGLGSTQNTCC
jgi:hypothetical protein